MKCKACAHFSNLVNENVFYKYSHIKESLYHLSHIIPNITNMSILGGEPLLHPEICKIMAVVRKLFPFASIQITTNGIILDKMPQSFFAVAEENRILISVSLYPPMYEHVDKIVDILKNNGVMYSVNRYDHFERRLLPRPVFEKRNMFEKCGHIMCLRGSQLGWCVTALYTDYYNRHFGRPILPEDSGVDIFAHNSGNSLLSALHCPLELCAQCVSRDTGRQYFQLWRPAGVSPKAEDWFIQSPFSENLEEMTDAR
jgi:hypothetical protein